jgi:DNA primase
VAYFEQRGLPPEVVRDLELGYIPPVVDKEQARKNKDGWEMRYWTDRIVFPLPDGGFTARALHLWTPGMDERIHKDLLDDLEHKTEAYNEQVMARYGEKEARQRKKGIISRYKTITPHNTYFHEQIIATSEHVTFVEGPFDVAACYAAGMKDAIAVGTNRIDIKQIPSRICDVTIAFDGDIKGQEAAASWERLLRRKGIAVRRVVLPADGQGKDWSERYRRHGRDGLAVLFDRPCVQDRSESIPDVSLSTETESELCMPDQCADCHSAITAEDREFFLIPIDDNQAVCYCSLCRDSQGQPLQPPGILVLSEEERRQQFLQQVQRLADSWPGGCTVHCDPPGYTLADRARELQVHHAEEPDYWSMIRSNIERPPVDETNRPFYSRQAWSAKL